MQRIVTFLFFMLFSFTATAENCPSVLSIKLNKASGWQAYDSDSDKPLAQTREARFRSDITQFALAEWSTTHNKNVMHCYYKNQDTSHLDAYFAKASMAPIKVSKYWYAVTGRMECAAGADKCRFQTAPVMQHQFAQNDKTSARRIINE